MQPSPTTISTSEFTPEQKRGLVVMRALYFLFFGGVGVYWTFINVYYRENLGLSGTEIGMVNTVAPLVGLIAATLWGVLNDRLGSPRMVLRIAIPGVIVSVLLLSTAETFLWVTLFSSLMALFNSAQIPLMDNTTLRLLGEQRGRYGRYRVLGSFGFILTSVSSGYLYAVTGLQAIFYAYALIMGLLLLCSSWLPNERVRLTGSPWSGLGEMVRQRAWLIFAICATLLWISNNGTQNFIGIAVQGMGGTAELIGLVSMMSAVVEVPILFTGHYLLERFGTTRLLVISFILFIVRSALLAVMPQPEWAIFISALSGAAFSLFWISSVAYANDSAPEALKSTAQGVLFSILNLAGMVGSLGSGWLFDVAGARGLFWGMSLIAAAGLVIFIAGRMRGQPAA